MAAVAQPTIDEAQLALDMKAQYEDQLTAANSEYSEAVRALSRARHEVQRLEKHLASIKRFCKDNNYDD